MIDLDELQKRTTRQSVLGGHGLDVVNMHGSDFDALIAELSALRARVAELERLSTELHHVALVIAARNALPDLITELHTLRARVAQKQTEKETEK